MVHGGRHRRLESRAADHAGWSAPLLRPCDYDSPDAARGVPPGAAPDRGTDRLGPPAARPRPAGTELLNPQPAGSGPRAAGADPRHRWGDPPVGGQFRAEAGWPGRMAG